MVGTTLGLLPLSWALVATVDAPQPGRLAANRHGPYVAIADVSSKDVKLYDGKGNYVRTVPGPDSPHLLSATMFTGIPNTVAMTPDGRIMLLKDSPDYIPRTEWHRPSMPPINVYKTVLGVGDLARSFRIVKFRADPELSWDRTAAYLTLAYNQFEIVTWPRGRTSVRSVRTRFFGHRSGISSIHALPGNKVATMAWFSPIGSNTLQVWELPGIRLIGKEVAGESNTTYYLSILDVQTGILEPIVGFIIQYDGSDASPRSSLVVFNNGKSIAVQESDKFYIFENLSL